MTEPNYPELRQRVREFAASQWGAPDDVVLLGRCRPGFDVPGRRNDGTVAGARLIRRFFWNILRGAAYGVGYVIAFLLTFEAPEGIRRPVGVRGPVNAQALGLLDAVRRARRAWLVCSETYVVALDSGSGFTVSDTPRPLKVLWHAEGPTMPTVKRLDHQITWPDGSEYTYELQGDEEELVHRDRKAWLWRDRRKSGAEDGREKP